MGTPVGIVIRAFREAPCLEILLPLIRSQAGVKDAEIVIVNTASGDGTEEIAKRYGCKVVDISSKEFTFGRSLNVGIAESRSKIVALLSAHAFQRDVHWLGNLTRPFESADVGAVYGRQEPLGDINPFEAGDLELTYGAETIEDAGTSFSDANGAIRRSLWESAPFDEKLQNSEEAPWALAVNRAGKRIVYVPSASVFHSHPLGADSFYRREFWSSYCQTRLLAPDRQRTRRELSTTRRRHYLGATRKLAQAMWRSGNGRYVIGAPMYEAARQIASYHGEAWAEGAIAPPPGVSENSAFNQVSAPASIRLLLGPLTRLRGKTTDPATVYRNLHGVGVSP